MEARVMTEGYERKLVELDDLINDPCIPLCPARIWQLAEEISEHAIHMTNVDQMIRRAVTE